MASLRWILRSVESARSCGCKVRLSNLESSSQFGVIGFIGFIEFIGFIACLPVGRC
jgi:hypothetical protein